MDRLRGELGSLSESGSSTHQGPVVGRALPGICARPQPTNPDVYSWGLDTVGKIKYMSLMGEKKKSQDEEQSM